MSAIKIPKFETMLFHTIQADFRPISAPVQHHQYYLISLWKLENQEQELKSF